MNKFLKALTLVIASALVITSSAVAETAYFFDWDGNGITGSAGGQIEDIQAAYYKDTKFLAVAIKHKILAPGKYPKAFTIVINNGPMPETNGKEALFAVDCTNVGATLDTWSKCQSVTAIYYAGPWANSATQAITDAQAQIIWPQNFVDAPETLKYADIIQHSNGHAEIRFGIYTALIDSRLKNGGTVEFDKGFGAWYHIFTDVTIERCNPFFQICNNKAFNKWYGTESFADITNHTSSNCPNAGNCPACPISGVPSTPDECGNCPLQVSNKVVKDSCGVCGGNGTSCCPPGQEFDNSNPKKCCVPSAKGCDGICDSGKVPDCANVCGGNGHLDQCDVCNGTDECLDCAGVPNGTSVRDKDQDCCLPDDLDQCNDCFGTNNCISTPTPTPTTTPSPTPTPKCPPPGKFDICGVCNGDGSSCCEEQSFTKEQLEIDGLLHEVSWLGLHLLNRLEVSFKLDGKLSVDEKQTLVGFRRDLIDERNNGWKVVWTEFASVQNLCTEEATCVRVSNTEALGEISASGDRELATVKKILERQRKVRGKKREDDTKIYTAAKQKNSKIKSLVGTLPQSSCP